MDLTEEQRQMIMRAMLGQGILGQTADVSQLQPIWQQMNVESQMGGGDPLPQFPEWYKLIQQQLMPQGINLLGQ